MQRRIAALAALAVASALLVGAPPPADATPPSPLTSVALVPLDDRPFPAHTPVSVAAAGASEALVPPEELLGEFFVPGDADAVADWWRDAAGQTDGSVVAVPMLAYGGLMASRSCGTSLEDARDRLQVLRDVAAENPDAPMYAFDVIQRLTIAPTSSYPGMYWAEVRRWAELIDLVDNLGREEFRAEYDAVAAQIPDEIKQDYLCARARNHEINKDMIRLVADGVLDYLILGQDDASTYGPHRAEKEALVQLIAELGVADRVRVYPGADVVGALLVAKLVIERLGVTPTVAVEWSRTPGDDWIAPYQDIPYGELVDGYIETIGAVRTESADADLLLMANTGGSGGLGAFAERIVAEVSRGRLVAIGDDVAGGVVDPELRDLVEPRIELASVAAWSGWNVGVSLAQGLVRAALLEASRDRPSGWPNPGHAARMLEEATAAHLQLLFAELVHTDRYRHQVRDAVRQFAVDAGDDPQYFTLVFAEANQLAVDRTTVLATELFAAEFAGVPVPIGAVNRREQVRAVGELSSMALALSWPRYQELDVHARISLASLPRSAHAVAVTLSPNAFEVRPDAELVLESTLILRNRTDRSAVVELSAHLPEGWSGGTDDDRVPVPALSTVEVPVSITAPALAAGTETTFEIVAAEQRPGPHDPAPVTAAGTVRAVWFNPALASNGAVATSSEFVSPYAPERVIDGNTSGIGSRWLTPVAEQHWLQVDFAEPAAIDTVDLYLYPNYLLQDYQVSVHVDGAWVVVADVEANAELNPRHTFELVVADGVRLDISATSDARARLYELETTCRFTEACFG